MLLSLTLILITSIVYLRLIRTLDRQSSAFWLTISLMWGGVSFGLALIVQNGLANGKLLSIAGIQLLSAPVLEELLKAVPLLLVLYFSHPRHGAVYGFAMGLGFALIESAVYITANPSYALGTALARVLSIHLIHGFTTALIGLIASRRVSAQRFGLVLLAAMLVHAAFNLLALSLDGGVLVIAAAYAGLGSAAVLVVLMSRRANLAPAVRLS